MDFEKFLDGRNQEDGFANNLGILTTKVDKGYAEGELKVKTEHYNYQGLIHGGVLFSFADTIGGSAARTYGYHVVTVNAHMEYIKGGENVETLYAYAKSIKHGNKISRYSIEIYDQLKNLLAVGTFTYYNQGRPVDY